MATLRHIYVLGKWVVNSGRRTFECAETFPGVWSDYTGQLDLELNALSIVIWQGYVTTAQQTSIQADNRFIILAGEDYDTVTQAYSNDNFSQLTTQNMANAFWTWVQANWPNVNPNMQTRINTLVGITRRQAVTTLIGWIKDRASAGV